jgi:hypothetical protein
VPSERSNCVMLEAIGRSCMGAPFDYFYNIAIKNPLSGVGWSVCELSYIA